MESMESLRITCLKQNRGFLEIYGIKKPELLNEIDTKISACYPHILKKSEVQTPNLEFDTIYLAVSDTTQKYHRCIIIEKRPFKNKALIELIDYGNEFEVDIDCLLELDSTAKNTAFLKEFPPVATKYFLANFYCTWLNSELGIIESLLRDVVLPITNEQMDKEYRYISLDFNGLDLAAKLKASNVGMIIPFTEQRLEVRKLFHRAYEFTPEESSVQSRLSPAKRRPNRPHQSVANNNIIGNQGKRMIQDHIATNVQARLQKSDALQAENVSSATKQIPAFIANDLQMGQYHVVFCSYVEDGPNLFSVHLKNQEHILDRMITDLSNAPRHRLSSKMVIGMACIARYSEDKAFYRAVIQKVQANGCRVTFIDYGNSEFVAFSEIYEIPNKFLEHKTFSIPFQLAGCNALQPIDDKLKEYFKTITNNVDLELRVVPSDNPQLQQCELFINNKSVLDLLKEKRMASNSYLPPANLKDGDEIIIRYAKTAKRFYVSRCKDIPNYDVMMDRLQTYCAKAPKIKTLPPIGKCCALLHSDNEYYRVIVRNQTDLEHVLIQLVDFGFEKSVELSKLREIDSTFLEIPRLAIECCLIDFENVEEVSETTGKQLEMIAEDEHGRTKFRVILRNRLPNSVHLVDLRDEKKNLNISISIYKLAMPRKPFNKRDSRENSSTEKSNGSIDTASKRSANENKNNRQHTQKADGAESPEKYTESRNERQNNKVNGDASNDRDKSNKYSNNNSRWRSNEPQKPSGNRSTNEIKTNENSQKTMLKKHIIPRFNKRNNRSAHNSNGKRAIGVDNNENYLESTVADSSGFHGSDISKMPGKQTPTETIVQPIVSSEFVGFNPKLPETLIPLNSVTKVNIVSWESPFKFHVQLKSLETECDSMVQQLQRFYQGRTPVQKKSPIDSFVVIRHKGDQTFQRGKVMDYNENRNKYKVKSIDFGDICIYQQTDIFELEKSFISLAPLAICCTFENVILNKSLAEIKQKIEPYVKEKNNYTECEFVATNNEKTAVEILFKGESFKDTMIRDQLIMRLPGDIRLERLIGQTVLLYLNGAADLIQFQAKLFGCDNLFMCSYKNVDLVKKNERLSHDFRSYTSSNNCIKAKIISISSENVLQVLIYLPFLDKDVDDIQVVGFPILKNEFVCEITHLEWANVLYVQDPLNMAQVEKLLEDLYNDFRKSGSLQADVKLGAMYSGLSTDGNVYRGVIEEIHPNDHALIRWIDYGNCEILPKSNIKELDNKYKQSTSAFANKMFVPIKPNDEQVEHEIRELINQNMEKSITAKIIDIHKSMFVCDFVLNGVSLYEPFEKTKRIQRLNVEQLFETIATQIRVRSEEPKKMDTIVESPEITEHHANTSPVVLEKPIEEIQSPSNIVENENERSSPNSFNVATISHADHPNQFYLQLVTDKDALAELEQLLQIVAPQLPALSTFRVGQSCVCKYSVDERWYRAKIIDTDGSITSIRFVDYGNTDTITDNTLLKSCNDSFDGTKPLAMLCSLPIESRGSKEWEADACKKLLNLIEVPLKYELVSKDNDLNYVKLFVGGRDIVKELLFEEHADQLEIINSGEKCFISHINSLDDFFIQVDSDTEALRLIEEHLRGAENFEILKNPKVGLICAAQFEDELYYRAQITSDTSNTDGFEVVFLDYGNTFRVTEVRILNPDIAQLPHLRKRCSMKLPDDIENWTNEALEQFRQKTEDGRTEMTVRLVKPGKRASVELFIGEENLAQTLSGFCEKKKILNIIIDDPENTIEKTPPVERSVNLEGYTRGKYEGFISHVNSASDFYIQLDSKTQQIEAMAVNLQAAENFKKYNIEQAVIGSVVAARFDDAFYRAKIISKNQKSAIVIFIDYGNDSSTDDLRELPDVLKLIEPLAINCRLPDTIANDFEQNDHEHFLNLSINEADTTFQIEFTGDSTSPATVHVYQNGRAIIEYFRSPQPKAANEYTATVDSIIEEAANYSKY